MRGQCWATIRGKQNAGTMRKNSSDGNGRHGVYGGSGGMRRANSRRINLGMPHRHRMRARGRAKRDGAGMTATKLFPSGAVEVSAIVGGYLMRRTYFGYTIRQAIKLFQREVTK